MWLIELSRWLIFLMDSLLCKKFFQLTFLGRKKNVVAGKDEFGKWDGGKVGAFFHFSVDSQDFAEKSKNTDVRIKTSSTDLKFLFFFLSLRCSWHDSNPSSRKVRVSKSKQNNVNFIFVRILMQRSKWMNLYAFCCAMVAVQTDFFWDQIKRECKEKYEVSCVEIQQKLKHSGIFRFSSFSSRAWKWIICLRNSPGKVKNSRLSLESLMQVMNSVDTETFVCGYRNFKKLLIAFGFIGAKGLSCRSSKISAKAKTAGNSRRRLPWKKNKHVITETCEFEFWDRDIHMCNLWNIPALKRTYRFWCIFQTDWYNKRHLMKKLFTCSSWLKTFRYSKRYAIKLGRIFGHWVFGSNVVNEMFLIKFSPKSGSL